MIEKYAITGNWNLWQRGTRCLSAPRCHKFQLTVIASKKYLFSPRSNHRTSEWHQRRLGSARANLKDKPPKKKKTKTCTWKIKTVIRTNWRQTKVGYWDTDDNVTSDVEHLEKSISNPRRCVVMALMYARTSALKHAHGIDKGYHLVRALNTRLQEQKNCNCEKYFRWTVVKVLARALFLDLKQKIVSQIFTSQTYTNTK